MTIAAQILTPGVFLEEAFRLPPPAFDTGVAAFVGRISTDGRSREPFKDPKQTVVSLDFAVWSALDAANPIAWAEEYLGFAVRGFFENGGRRCYIVRLDAANDNLDNALSALDAIEDFDILCAPDFMPVQPAAAAVAGIWVKLFEFCDTHPGCFAILDAIVQPEAIVTPQAGKSIAMGIDDRYRRNAALYANWIKVRGCLPCNNTGVDAQGRPCPTCSGTVQTAVPPSGHIAGVYARTDRQQGVHKAPANEVLEGALDLGTHFDDVTLGALNNAGVNCLRAFPGRGIRIWGARTLDTSDPTFKFVNARRMFLTVTRWLDQAMSAVTFEPNDLRLWARIGREVGAFLDGLFRRGALTGASPSEAFYVKCDGETNPPEVRAAGKVITEVGLALARPSEFVVVRLVSGATGTSVTGAPLGT